MKEKYSPWTATAVHRLMVGVFALAVRDDVITRSPADRFSAAERPSQKNAKDIERLDSVRMSKLIAAASTERWRAALGLAGLGGLRLGEVRGIKWEDIDFEANALYVRRSLLPSGDAKGTKSDAGRRTVLLLPELRRLLRTWQIKSPRTDPADYIISTHDGGDVAERNLRRALDSTKKKAKLDGGRRLSSARLRHSAGSIWLTEHGQPDHDRERDDGAYEPGVHAQVLRAGSPRRADDDRGRARPRHQQQGQVPEVLASPEAAEVTDPRAFWTGRLSASIAYFLVGQLDKSDLRTAYREALRSPACTIRELRAILRDISR